MRKEIRRVDAERGICCVTTEDERFYTMVEPDPNTGLDRVVYRPSVTWICDTGYPKGKGFNQWLKNNGDESDQIARLAADRGYKVHRACAELNAGNVVKISDRFDNPSTGRMEELTTDEYAAVMSYADWWRTEGREKYTIMACEFTTWPDAVALAKETGFPEAVFNYAGTIDLKVRRIGDDTVGIIDMKTSSDIWPSMEMQVNAYRVAERADWQAILQLDYRRNKYKKWKFTEIENKFTLFRATMAIWQNECNSVAPLQRDFPLELKLA